MPYWRADRASWVRVGETSWLDPRGLQQLLDHPLDPEGKIFFAGIQLDHLDLGGGLGVRYRDESPPTPQQYIGEVRELLGERQILCDQIGPLGE